MKLICEYPVSTLRNAGTSANIGAVANAIKTMPGVGKPFLIFAPDAYEGQVQIAAFSMFPQYVVSAVVSENVEMINAMLAEPPLEALTF